MDKNAVWLMAVEMIRKAGGEVLPLLKTSPEERLTLETLFAVGTRPSVDHYRSLGSLADRRHFAGYGQQVRGLLNAAATLLRSVRTALDAWAPRTAAEGAHVERLLCLLPGPIECQSFMLQQSVFIGILESDQQPLEAQSAHLTYLCRTLIRQDLHELGTQLENASTQLRQRIEGFEAHLKDRPDGLEEAALRNTRLEQLLTRLDAGLAAKESSGGAPGDPPQVEVTLSPASVAAISSSLTASGRTADQGGSLDERLKPLLDDIRAVTALVLKGVEKNNEELSSSLSPLREQIQAHVQISQQLREIIEKGHRGRPSEEETPGHDSVWDLLERDYPDASTRIKHWQGTVPGVSA